MCFDEYVNNTKITRLGILAYIKGHNISYTRKSYIEHRERVLYAMMCSYNINKQLSWNNLVKDCFSNKCIDCGCDYIYTRCDTCKTAHIRRVVSKGLLSHFMRKRKAKYMKHKLVEKGYDKNKTESQIMHELCCYRICVYVNLSIDYRHNIFTLCITFNMFCESYINKKQFLCSVLDVIEIMFFAF